MRDYRVREICGRIHGQIQSNSATDAALYFANHLIKTTVVQESILVFEVEIDDNIVRVSVHLEEHAGEDETLHFPDTKLEPLETPLALSLTRKYRTSNGRPTKITK